MPNSEHEQEIVTSTGTGTESLVLVEKPVGNSSYLFATQTGLPRQVLPQNWQSQKRKKELISFSKTRGVQGNLVLNGRRKIISDGNSIPQTVPQGDLLCEAMLPGNATKDILEADHLVK